MNPWISHVKKVAEEKGITYRDALKVASSTYSGVKSKGGSVVKTTTTRQKTAERIATKLKKNTTVTKNKTPSKVVLKVIKKQSSNPDWKEVGKKVAIEVSKKASHMALEKYGLDNFVTDTLVDYIVPFVVNEMFDYMSSSSSGKGVKDFPYTSWEDLPYLIDDVIDQLGW